ncbi:MAG: HD domain-containing protein [Clostridiales Family XIII bacterium]|nr:HD domain-containing protein [Clostridiales Family XIII bacterium]
MNKYRVLYIGGDGEERDALTRILSSDHDFVSCASIEEAMRISLRETPDLFLVSRTADGASAEENVARLTDHKRLRNVPVIIVKGRGVGHEGIFDDRIVDTAETPFVDADVRHRVRVHLNIARRDKAMREQMEALSNGLLSSISEMVECRDENTGGHIARTSKYVMLLGMDLVETGAYGGALSSEDVERMARAAPLHDIGKVGVSDLILLKPARLTVDEFDAMKRHTLIGKAMIDRLLVDMPSQTYLTTANEIAVTHHEKYDGSGYPYGLSAEDIPIGGRIMAVADVYDALVADRVYRKAMTQEEAYRIITESEGAHFDPRVVKAFDRVFDMLSALSENANEKMAAI